MQVRIAALLAACFSTMAVTSTHTVARAQSPRVSMPTAADWPLNNLDIGNRRFSTLNQINTSNAATLAQQWTFDVPQGESVESQTPLVIDGLMYVNSGSKTFAIDAATGKLKWTSEMTPAFTGFGRGPAYGDGRIYAFGSRMMYALDATTGAPVESFGEKGVLPIVNRALDFKMPGKYPPDFNVESIGYTMSNPPTYFNGTLYVGVPYADSMIDGGLVIAADGKTGAIKWVFRAVPQGPEDSGWEIAKDTWRGSDKRQGGGVWTTPAIDPELGMLYINVSNPTPNMDGSTRKGMNLFTNSMVALDLNTGALKWYFQTLHHDIWDRDLVAGPTLFDATANGRSVKGIGSLLKTCYAFLLNRATGEPINPIVETPVPTNTDVPGEEVWPTQPIPYTARGTPQEPLCATYPNVTDPELAKRVRTSFEPFKANELVIVSPGGTGGPNFGQSSFSPRTGLFYVTGKNSAWSLRVKPLTGPIQPGPTGPASPGHRGTIAGSGPNGMVGSQQVSAYDPISGKQVWTVTLPTTTNTGTFVTAGDILVQNVSRDFHVLDARSGAQLFKATFKAVTRSTPMTYAVRGKQYIAFVSGATIVAFGLP